MTMNSDQFKWPPLGQDKAVFFLEKSILSGKLVQSYIFSGSRDLGKTSLALAFARNLWNFDRKTKAESNDFSSLNTDLNILEKEADKKQIGVEQTREFIKNLSLSSFHNSYKIGIVKDAELLSLGAQNALLKTLEEPREKVIIILITENVELLTATISSRAQILYFYPVSTAAVYDYLLASSDINRSLAKEISAASMGKPLQALHWLEEPEEYREQTELVKQLFNFINLDLAGRLDLIGSLVKLKDFSLEKAESYLAIWESLWHDALLVSLGHEDHLAYPNFCDAWKKYFQEHPNVNEIHQAFTNLKQLRKSDEYLRAFVSPKSILESLSLYF